MRSDELIITWRVTSACNLDCRFCAYSRSLVRPRAAASPDQVLAFGALLQEYSRQYGRDILVSWLGGEPLSWPPLAELTHAFKHKFRLRVSVTTNGIALASSAVCERVLANYDQITISVDGLGSFHDQLRGAPGLYEQLGSNVTRLTALKAARGQGPLIRVNTILMRHTVYQLEALGRALAAWGVEELTFNTLGGRDRPEFFPGHRLLPEHVAWLRQELPGLRERLAGLRLRVCGSPGYLERLARFAQDIQVPGLDCAPGRHVLFIDEHGRASPCTWTASGYGIPLADISSPAELHDLPVRFGARRQQHVLPPCLDCPSTQVFGKFDPCEGNQGRRGGPRARPWATTRVAPTF